MKPIVITGMLLSCMAMSSLAQQGTTQLNVITNEIEMKPKNSWAYFRVIDEVGDPAIKPSSADYGYIGTSDYPLWRMYSYYINGTVITESSDERLKENVQDLGGGVLAKVKSLRAVSYNRIPQATGRGHSHREIGFLAQNVQAHFPEIVSLDSSSGYYGVQYSRAVPVLVKAIQEQQSIIEQQSQLLQQQQAQINQIRARLGM